MQQELEDADVDDSELKEYTDSLDEFIRAQAVLENLGKPFQEVLGDTSQPDRLYGGYASPVQRNFEVPQLNRYSEIS